MKIQKRTRGFTMVEILIASLAMTVLGAGIWTLIRTSYDAQYMIMDQNYANTNARATVDTLADSMRGMTTLTAAAASDCTYVDNNGNNVRYWRNTADNTLRKSDGTAGATGTIVLNGVGGLTFTYYQYSGGAWQAGTSTPGTLSAVGAIDITVTGNIGGFTRQVFSSVKLRQMRFNNTNGF